jgi:hypothetical protein
MELTLCGSEPVIRSALKEWNILEWSVPAAGQYCAVLKLSDQETLDRCIDRLRSLGIGIVELVRRRDTLEEAFLGIVKQQPSPFLE